MRRGNLRRFSRRIEMLTTEDKCDLVSLVINTMYRGLCQCREIPADDPVARGLQSFPLDCLRDDQPRVIAVDYILRKLHKALEKCCEAAGVQLLEDNGSFNPAIRAQFEPPEAIGDALAIRVKLWVVYGCQPPSSRIPGTRESGGK